MSVRYHRYIGELWDDLSLEDLVGELSDFLLQSGFEMHLAKPVDPGELVASVATLARRVKAESQSD